MKSKKKILVVRFNSIGDIVLTTPTLEALYNAGYEVHFLMKSAYKEILAHCPFVHRIWILEDSMKGVLDRLKEEKYYAIVDLHNNFRSRQVCFALRKRAFVFRKNRIAMFLMIQFGLFRKKQKHVVLRFLDTIHSLAPIPDHVKVRLFLPKGRKTIQDYTRKFKNYTVIVVGAAFFTKSIPVNSLIKIIHQSKKNIVLIGGPEDVENARKITDAVDSFVLNLTGKLSILESASIIADAETLISGDTGMMHIGNALEVKTIAVFGSTHPILGYTPFNSYNKDSSIVQNSELSCRPCTKQGKNSCPKGHFKCMIDININAIVDKM